MAFGRRGGEEGEEEKEGSHWRPESRAHCSPVSEVAEQTDCLCAELFLLKSPETLKHHGTSKSVTAQ